MQRSRHLQAAHQLHDSVGVQGQANTARRDELLRYQKEAQKRWQEDKLFEVDAPAEGQRFFLAALLLIPLNWCCFAIETCNTFCGS